MSKKTPDPAGSRLSRAGLKKLLQVANVEQISFARLAQLVRQEPGLPDYRPDSDYQVDPRTGDRIVYSSARGRRPHDHPPAEAIPPAQDCIVCRGKITGIIDVADLSQGFTFINTNLYPILYPRPAGEITYTADWGEKSIEPQGRAAYGLHLLQWTSSLHRLDWHNLPLADRQVVLQRLAVLEKKLLTGAPQAIPAAELWSDGEGRYGFVSIIKNYGRLVGGSLEHGHQQIIFSNMMPRRVRDNWRFQQQRGEFFSAYLLRQNPPSLLVRDYGPAVLLVAYFMRRPLDMLLLLKDAEKRYLHDLDPAELSAVAAGWHDAIRAIRRLMPQLGRETAYNVVTHTGPGAGLYFEFLPYTQEMGGFEHLGLLICQANPHHIAARIRAFLNGKD